MIIIIISWMYCYVLCTFIFKCITAWVYLHFFMNYVIRFCVFSD